MCPFLCAYDAQRLARKVKVMETVNVGTAHRAHRSLMDRRAASSAAGHANDAAGLVEALDLVRVVTLVSPIAPVTDSGIASPDSVAAAPSSLPRTPAEWDALVREQWSEAGRTADLSSDSAPSIASFLIRKRVSATRRPIGRMESGAQIVDLGPGRDSQGVARSGSNSSRQARDTESERTTTSGGIVDAAISRSSERSREDRFGAEASPDIVEALALLIRSAVARDRQEAAERRVA
jgi:hypothetical protein